MWTFVFMVCGLFISILGLVQSIRQRKHPRKNSSPRRKNVQRYDRNYNDNNDGEMTEEEMIAEDYYYYRDQE